MSSDLSDPGDLPAMATATLWLLNGQHISAERLALLAAHIGPGERARLTRFLRPQRARQFLLGRLLLRHAVCSSLQLANHDIAIIEHDGAAPELSISAASPFHFSLSHSHDWIACVTSTSSAALGIDIEDRQQERDLNALASAAFDLQQQAWLAQFSAAQRPAAFYRLWNCLEALYKLGAQANGANCRIIEHAQLAICLCSALPLERVDVVEITQL